ncbi:MAG: DegV family protein [Dehalococcoidales bacterium]|nr:DegV family protein [Dehalococcoidales bacterium]
MKSTMIVTDTLSSMTPELAGEYDVRVVPYHLIMDGKDYLDNTYDRNLLFTRLESYRNLPTTSASTTGDILKAYEEASQMVKNILYIAISSVISASYNAALRAREIAKEELHGVTIEVVDCRTAICGQLLVVLAAARAASEGKSLPEIVDIAHQVTGRVTYLTVPETMFFFERAGRAGTEAPITKAPLKIYPVVEIDSTSGGVPRFITKNRTKARAVEKMLEMVSEKGGNKKLNAAVSYTNNTGEVEELRNKLLSRFDISGEVHITPHSTAACVVGGPRTLALAFYPED